jgi:hypothetical protein
MRKTSFSLDADQAQALSQIARAQDGLAAERALRDEC